MAFESKEVDLDARDWALLTALQENARLTFADLARRVKLTPPAVAERVRRMEDAGVITGYHATVRYENIGRNLRVFFRVVVPPREYPRFLKMVEKMPEVLECSHVTGAESFVLKAVLRSVTQLEEVIKKLTGFGETTTSVVLSTSIDRKTVGPESS